LGKTADCKVISFPGPRPDVSGPPFGGSWHF
jgi:hypothetical protein